MSKIELLDRVIHWDSNFEHGYALTTDPRIVGYLRREIDGWPRLEECWVGDGVRFNYDYGSRREPTYKGCRDCCETPLNDAWEQAEGMWGANSWRGADDERIARFLHIFHGVEVVELRSAVDRYLWAEVLVPVGTYNPKDYEWLQAHLDGDVFGIGYGVCEDAEEWAPGEFDFDMFDADVVVWGFEGEEYALDSIGYNGLLDEALEELERPLTYRVTWEMDIEATSPGEAAEQALAIHRDPHSIATCFTVSTGSAEWNVDLAKELTQ